MTTPHLTDDELARLRELCEAATTIHAKETASTDAEWETVYEWQRVARAAVPKLLTALDEARGKCVILTGAVGDLAAQRDTEMARVDTLVTLLNKALDREKKAHKPVDKLLDANEALRADRDRLTADLSAARAELAAARGLYEHVSEDRNGYADNYERVAKECDELKARNRRRAAERDEALVRAATAEQAAENWKRVAGTGLHSPIDKIERETAEAIAAWLDGKAERLKRTLDATWGHEERTEFEWGLSYTEGAAADIRAGKWRTK